jgi:hypothetical protein
LDFLEFATDSEPARFCFIIDRGHDGAAEPRVEFVGFTPSGVIACRLVSNAVRVLRLEGQQNLPQPVVVAKPLVAPKRREEGDAPGIARFDGRTTPVASMNAFVASLTASVSCGSAWIEIALTFPDS